MKSKLKYPSLVMNIKITLKDKRVVSAYSHKKVKMFHFFQANSDNFLSAYLMVKYKNGIYNEGRYKTKREFITAWKSFLDDDLIQDALTY